MDCKACTKCGEVKALDNAFPFNKATRDGRCSWCRACHAFARRIRYAENPAPLREIGRRNYAAHKDIRRESHRAWRADNADKTRAYEVRLRDELAPIYIANLLRISIADLTPELLAAKCEQLELHRLGRAIKQHLKETK